MLFEGAGGGSSAHPVLHSWRAVKDDDPARVQDNGFAGLGVSALSRPFESDEKLTESRDPDMLAVFQGVRDDLKEGVDNVSRSFPGERLILEFRKQDPLPVPTLLLEAHFVEHAIDKIRLVHGVPFPTLRNKL